VTDISAEKHLEQLLNAIPFTSKQAPGKSQSELLALFYVIIHNSPLLD
jgi:hypothetical protein